MMKRLKPSVQSFSEKQNSQKADYKAADENARCYKSPNPVFLSRSPIAI